MHQVLLVQPEHIQHVLASHAQNYWKGLGLKKIQLMLGNGLFTSEGKLWRRRRLMQPPFTARGIAQFADDMVAATETMLGRWSAAARQGKPLDIDVDMMRLTMSIIGRTMFSVDIGEEALEAGAALSPKYGSSFSPPRHQVTKPLCLCALVVKPSWYLSRAVQVC